MKLVKIAIVLGCLATPALAQSLDFPRLTWPTAPTSQGCSSPVSLGVVTRCATK